MSGIDSHKLELQIIFKRHLIGKLFSKQDNFVAEVCYVNWKLVRELVEEISLLSSFKMYKGKE